MAKLVTKKAAVEDANKLTGPEKAAVILLALGFIQRDGLCILLGHGANLATIIYFGGLIAGGGLALQQAAQQLSSTQFH